MFDHLVPHGTSKIKRNSPHKLIAVTTAISLILSFGIIWMMRAWFAPIQFTVASATDVTIQLLSDPFEDTVVTRPVSHWVLAELQIHVSPDGITDLRDFSFSLTGKYAPTDIEAVALYIDNAQVGYPVRPDAFGVVSFPIDSLELQPGSHRAQIKFTITDSDSESLFKIVFSPDSLIFTNSGGSPDVTFKRPYSTETIRVTRRGSINAYVAPQVSGKEGVVLYAEGEDVVIQNFVLEGTTDKPIGLMYNGEPLETVEQSDDGLVRLSKPVYILRRSESVLRSADANAGLRIVGIGVEGVTSGTEWTQTVDLPL